MKTCTRCLIEQPDSAFRLKKADGTARRAQCLACHRINERVRSSNPSYRASRLASVTRYLSTPHGSRKRILYRASRRHFELKILRDFALSLAAFDALICAQTGRCAGCMRPFANASSVCVDHCHSSLKVRGLLCDGCNKAIGFAKNSPDTLRSLAYYLEVSNAPTC